MAQANIIILADAIVSELNSQGWSLNFVARRLYRPRFTAEDLAILQASVVPRALTIEAACRAGDTREYRIDLAIQQKLNEESIEEIDPLVAQVDEIARHFRLRRLTAIPAALCVKVENDPIYAVEHLDQLRCFTSIVTLTFRMMDD